MAKGKGGKGDAKKKGKDKKQVERSAEDVRADKEGGEEEQDVREPVLEPGPLIGKESTPSHKPAQDDRAARIEREKARSREAMHKPETGLVPRPRELQVGGIWKGGQLEAANGALGTSLRDARSATGGKLPNAANILVLEAGVHPLPEHGIAIEVLLPQIQAAVIQYNARAKFPVKVGETYEGVMSAQCDNPGNEEQPAGLIYSAIALDTDSKVGLVIGVAPISRGEDPDDPFEDGSILPEIGFTSPLQKRPETLPWGEGELAIWRVTGFTICGFSLSPPDLDGLTSTPTPPPPTRPKP